MCESCFAHFQYHEGIWRTLFKNFLTLPKGFVSHNTINLILVSYSRFLLLHNVQGTPFLKREWEGWIHLRIPIKWKCETPNLTDYPSVNILPISVGHQRKTYRNCDALVSQTWFYNVLESLEHKTLGCVKSIEQRIV